MKKVIYLFVFLLGSSAYSQSTTSPESKQSAAVADSKKKSNPTVLDFEADVIEGERKTPDLFIQLSMEKAKTESVIFDRKNFNDFHAIDSRKRSKYQEK